MQILESIRKELKDLENDSYVKNYLELIKNDNVISYIKSKEKEQQELKRIEEYNKIMDDYKKDSCKHEYVLATSIYYDHNKIKNFYHCLECGENFYITNKLHNGNIIHIKGIKEDEYLNEEKVEIIKNRLNQLINHFEDDELVNILEYEFNEDHKSLKRKVN